MKHLITVSVAFLALGGCAAKLAALDCEDMGYTRGTPEFSQCAERQVAARHNKALRMRQQDTDVSIACQQASGGIFGRNTGRTDCPTPAGMMPGRSQP